MKFKTKIVIFLFIAVVIIFISIVSSGVDGVIGVDLNVDPPTFNNGTAFVNSSEIWVTNIGALDDVNATQFENNGGIFLIDIGWLKTFGDGLWCALTGCVMTGDIDMGGNDINNAETITANNFIGDGSGLTSLPGGTDNDFHIFINGSAFNNIIYNLTAGDVNDVTVTVEPGRKFIFGEIFT